MRNVWLAVLLMLAGAAHSDPIADGERLQLADGLYAREMFKPAADEYESFLKDFPSSPSVDAARFRLAECYRELGNTAAADKEYARVFANFPSSPFSPKAGLKRASLLKDAKKFDDAVDLYRAVLARKPSADVAGACLYLLGDCLKENGKITEAEAAFRELTETYETSPFGAHALLQLGESAAGPGPQAPPKERLDKAMAFYRRADKAAPSDRLRAEAVFQMAELQFRAGAFGESAAFYKRLLQTWPADRRSAGSKLQAAWAAHNAGLYAEALSLAVEALKTESTKERGAEWLYLKANCERQLTQNDAALRTYAELLDTFPDSRFAVAARYEKAIASYKAGRYADAVADAQKIVGMPETQKDVYWLLAESYAGMKQDDEAIQYYRLLIRDFPKSDVACDATYRLAHQLQTRMQYDEASRYYTVASANWPDHVLAPQALLASGICLAKAGKHKDAIRDWATLAQRYPTHALVEEALYQKAMSETRMQLAAEAQASLRDLLRRYPDSRFKASALFWQGMLQRDLGKTHDAEESLRTALKSHPDAELAREASFYLGGILQAGGKSEEAAALFQPLLATPMREKFTPAVLQWLTEYWLARKDNARAAEAAQTLVGWGAEPEWQQIGWTLKGRAHLAAGVAGEAEAAFKKALALKLRTAFSAESALHLGEITLAASHHKEAADYFKQSSEIAAADALLAIRARAYIGLARTAKATAEYGAAARYYMSVAVLFDDADLVPECLYEAAAAFRRAGDAKAADAASKELQTRYPASEWAKKHPEP